MAGIGHGVSHQHGSGADGSAGDSGGGLSDTFAPSQGPPAATSMDDVFDIMRTILSRMTVLEGKLLENAVKPEDIPVPITPMSTGSKPWRDGRERTPLSQMRNMKDVESYSGKLDDYAGWKKTLSSCLRDEPGLGDLLKWIEEHPETITCEEIKKYPKDSLLQPVEVYDQQLHTLLEIKTTSTAAAIVEASGESGFLAWQKLTKHGGMITPSMRRKLLSQLLHPQRAKNLEDLVSAQEIWEVVRQRYAKTAKEAIPNDVLV